MKILEKFEEIKDEICHFKKSSPTLQELQVYIKNKNNALTHYEWCFSKIVENIDSLYIPYFDTQNQVYRKFYPDFIFWLRHKQTKEYKIFFIDPKGLSYEANARVKVEGYRDIFSLILLTLFFNFHSIFCYTSSLI